MPGSTFSICPLASGSSGNAVLISAPGCNILVDAGLSGIQLEKRLARVGVSPVDISALIITHEHTDHIKGAGVLHRRYQIPLYMNRNTCLAAAAGIGKIKPAAFFDCGTPFTLGKIKVAPFSISHDAADPAGITFTLDNKKLGLATDMGVITGLVRQHLKECSVVYLESNHDPDMLMNGSYPWSLKQRVKGRTGHLSNLDTRDFVRDLAKNNLKHVILAHLSEENNTPGLAVETVRKGLDSCHVSIDVALPDRPGILVPV